MGYICETATGRWLIQYSIRDTDGKPRRRSKRVRGTRADAAAALADLESKTSNVHSKKQAPRLPAPPKPKPKPTKPPKPTPFKPLLIDDEYTEVVLAAGGIVYRTPRQLPKPLPLPMSIHAAIERLNIERLLSIDGVRDLDDAIASGTVSFDDGDSVNLSAARSLLLG